MSRSRGMIWPAKDCPPKLGLDEACLNVVSEVDYPVYLYEQVDECHVSACDELLWKEIPARHNVSLLVNSAYELFIIHTNKDHLKSCGETFQFSEHKTYSWKINDNCPPIWPRPRMDLQYWLPVCLAPVVIILAFVLWMGAKWVYRSYRMASFQSPNLTFSNMENNLNVPESNESQTSIAPVAVSRPRGSRVFSLDTFRGMCISMMIFVNYGGGEYKIFRHSAWNGLTFADLVFPWFLWVMGVSLVVSLRSQLRNSQSRIAVWLLVVRRSVILICLGLVLNSLHGHNALSFYRIPGVLQRIGLAYFIIASVETCFMNPGGPQHSRICEDIIYGWIQNLVASLLVLTWLIVTFLVPVPGICGRGYLGPGGLDKHGRFENCTGGAAGYIDRLIFTPNHIYQHPTCEKVFMTTQPYDPEGLLGTLTAALLVHLGAQASRILICYNNAHWARIFRWILWGALLCLCAGILCEFQLGNKGYIPINKNLFSLSYVLLTGGAAFIIFALLYRLIDYDHFCWDGTPFKYAGRNAILLYVGHELVRGMFPWSWKPIWDIHVELLVMNLWGTSLWLLIAYILWRKNIFLTF